MKKSIHPLRVSAIIAGLLATANLALAVDNEVWTGNPNVTASTNWSDTANWSGTSHNANDNNIYFGAANVVVAGVINSVVDTSTNCFSLNFTNTTSYNNVLIQPGQILKIDGANAGYALTVNPLGAIITTNTISGATGTLLITGPAAGGVFVASTNAVASNIAPTLDMSGLGTFIMSNTAATGALLVGDGGNRSDGVLTLAMTNYLSLSTNGTGNNAALILGDNTSNNGSSPGGLLNLGITNTILADNINVGLSKQNGATMRFNPAFTNAGANPFVYIRGFSTTAVKRWAIGDGLGQTGTSPAGSGTVDFRNGTVNAVVTTMVLGRPSNPGQPAPSSSGMLSFSAGSISVVNLTNALMTTVGTGTNQVATGTISIYGTGTFTANSVTLAVFLAGSGGSSTGTFNITNGTLAVGSIIAGGGTSTINVNGGTFIVTNTVGTAAAPLTALNLTGGTLQLSVNGTANVTNIVATTVGTSGTTTITIASVANVTIATTIPLISYTGTDPFGSLTLTPLTGGFSGTLVDNSSNGRIDLLVNPPTAGASLVWVGATNSVLTSLWDTVTPDWLNVNTLAAAVYADLDPLQFDDNASNSVVNLTTTVAPFSILVTNNARSYTISGAGKITGSTSLIKNGPGSLTLAEAGGDNFNGGIIVSNGTLVLDNASSGITGGLNIAGGSVQIGNNDANGNLPSGTLVNNGALIFNRTDALTFSTAIPGTGSLTKLNNNTLTLSGGNGFAGNLLVSAGTVRLSSNTAQGAGNIIVTNTGTVVLSVALSNNIILSGGTLGESATINPLTNDLTATAGTTSLIYEADPQNLTPGDANEMSWSNTLHGSGSIIVATVTNDATSDGGNGFRLRGTSATTFSGSITLSNNVKGELQTTVASAFSPAGTGKFYLVCGTYLGNNSTTNQVTGINNGYTEFNLRNNSSGNCVFGNDVQILGSGYTTLDPLGTAPTGASVTMGNLTIGNGQELGVYLSATPNHVIIFPTVTLTGDNARFSPKTPGFGALTSVGSDLSLGNISEQTPGSGIVMAGWRTLFLTGTNTYTGNTLVTNGTLALTGSASISNTPSISISSGTTFDVSGLTSAFTLGAGQTLTGLGATGTFAGSATLAAGAITLNYNGTPTLTVTNGTLTLNNNSLTVTNLGTILNAGSYKLISAASSGSVGAVAGAVGSSTVNVLGAGASGGALITLKIVGGELYLVVNHPPVANNVSYVRGSVNSWQIPVANLLTNASDVDISDTLTLSSVGTSTNGITLSIAGGYVSYLNANLVNDQFNYTVADGNGGSATGTVTLVAAPFTSGQSATVTVSGSSATVGFAGIPGYKYEVQRSTNLLSWVTIQTTNAPGGGVFSVTDNFSDLGTVPGSAYYRLSWNGN